MFVCWLCAALPVSAALPQVASGRLERLADFPSRHVPARHVDVWLPDGYPAAAPYDVLYMHDGQMLFDAATTWNGQEWRVDEVAGALAASGEVRPFIVVGIWNAGAARASEYFPQKPFQALAPAQRDALLAQRFDDGRPLFDGPAYADRYLRFLVEELKPRIDARYATAPGRGHTFVMGSSMGGLVSMYALAEYPDVFGGAACLSTHWPGSISDVDNPVPAAFLDYMARHLPAPGRHRLWFDHGTETLDARYPPLQRRVDALLREKGWREPGWITRVYAGAAHDERAWAARLHEPLRFLLAPAVSAPSPAPEASATAGRRPAR